LFHQAPFFLNKKEYPLNPLNINSSSPTFRQSQNLFHIMITFRRALVAAAFIMTCLLLLRSSHSQHDSPHREQEIANDAAQSDELSSTEKTTISKSSFSDRKQQQVNQISLQDLSKAPLRDQLAYQFPYDVEMKFPAYIWQTWKYTPASGNFADRLRPAEASWTEKHPTFVHEVITDTVAVHLIRHLYASVPSVIEAYDALPMPILKADFFRYLVLLARGGIYSDIDTIALKPAIEWIPDEVPISSVGLVIGIEADPDRSDWASWYSRRVQFCQWTIQAKPGHPVLAAIVARITEETLQMKKAGTLKDLKKSVVEFTGPAVWTDTVMEFFNDKNYFDMSVSPANITALTFTGMKQPKKIGDVVVLPITSFSPGVGQMGAEETDHPLAYVKHEFEGKK
jgi:alpha 1,6-mannosyltransferase